MTPLQRKVAIVTMVGTLGMLALALGNFALDVLDRLDPDQNGEMLDQNGKMPPVLPSDLGDRVSVKVGSLSLLCDVWINADGRPGTAGFIVDHNWRSLFEAMQVAARNRGEDSGALRCQSASGNNFVEIGARWSKGAPCVETNVPSLQNIANEACL